MDIKTAWRDFGSAANCPATQFYCNGRFALVTWHKGALRFALAQIAT